MIWSTGRPTEPPWHDTPYTLKAKCLPTRLVPGEREFDVDGWRDKGFDEADMPTKERWRQDGCRLSTYQCAAHNLLWHLTKWRYPSADELDVLLGFPKGFTDVPPIEEKPENGCWETQCIWAALTVYCVTSRRNLMDGRCEHPLHHPAHTLCLSPLNRREQRGH